MKNRRVDRLRSRNRKMPKALVGLMSVVVLSLVTLATMEIMYNKPLALHKEESADVADEQKPQSTEQDSEFDPDYVQRNKDSADDATEIENSLFKWNFQRSDGQKVAYLTFDDGPSEETTVKILDTLQKYDARATFFVLGSNVEKSEYAKTNLKKIAASGNAIGNHGYSHKYEVLYPHETVDVKTFVDDMQKSEDILKSVLGQDFHTRLIRFPGGHSSWKANGVDEVLHSKDLKIIDWNTLNGDAENNNLPPAKLLENLKKTVTDINTNNDTIVVLMHDRGGKETTAEYLPQAIEYLKSLGYTFRTMK